MRRSVPATVTLVLALVGALLLAGCGSTDSASTAGSTAKATTTTAKKADTAAVDKLVIALGDIPFTDAQKQCVAEKVVPEVSAGGLDILTRPQEDSRFSALDSADQKLVVSAFDTCVPLSDAATALGGAFVSDDNLGMGDSELQCVGEKIVADYKGTGEALVALEKKGEAEFSKLAVEAIGGCIKAETLTTYFAQKITEQGLPADQSNCIAKELVDKLGGTELIEQFRQASSGGVSADLQAQITAAASGCVGGG